MSQIRCIVLDFDGTFTLVDEEAEPFVGAFRAELAKITGAQLASRWDEMGARVDGDPGHYGWEHDERIVAPAHSDPYVRSTTIAQLLLSEMGLSATERRERIEPVFRAAYPHSRIVFRPDAAATIEALLAKKLPIFVVTNSATDHVIAKIAKLGVPAAREIPVHGDARKYAVEELASSDPDFDAVPETERVEGLPRPIWLRRGAYFSALKDIWTQTRTDAASTLVCGDIYELDLALPARLGARIHHVARPQTPAHERVAVTNAGGTVSDALAGVLDAF